MEPKRSVGMRIDKDVYAKLLVVCEAYGSNVNSYIINELGRSISRDYEAVTLKASSEAVFTKFSAIADLMKSSLDDENLDKIKQ